MQNIDTLTFALLVDTSFFPSISVNSVTKEFDQFAGEGNTLIVDDNSSTDSNNNDDDNYFCTQGDNEESFAFGSQAGLFTQAAEDSQEFSDSDGDLENVGNALGIDDDDVDDAGKDNASDEDEGEDEEERPSESDIVKNSNAINAKEVDSNLVDTTGFTEETDCRHHLNESGNANSEDLNNVSKYVEFIEETAGAETRVEGEEHECGENVDCNEQKESSETTLLYEDSLTPSPFKPRQRNQHETEIEDNETTGFTEDEEMHYNDKPDMIPNPITGTNSDTEIIASKMDEEKRNERICDAGECGETLPGFTESTQSQSRSGNTNSEKVLGDESVEAEKGASSGEIDHMTKDTLIDVKAFSENFNKRKMPIDSNDEVLRSIANKEQTTNVILEEKLDAAPVQNNETSLCNLDTQIPTAVALFSGDTQSIPSQFPLTLEDKDRDERASAYSNDSFCAGSTEKIMAGTTPSNQISTPVRHEHNIEARSQVARDVCDTLNFDCEVVGFIAPSEQDNQKPLGHEKRADSGKPSNDKSANDVPKRSILNLTSTPRDDCLSYPKDFMSHKSSGTETLTTTPLSQVLLEPQHQKQSYASVVHKVSSLRYNTNNKADDAIDNSSDEEDVDEIINDPSQNSEDLRKDQVSSPLNTDSFKRENMRPSTTGWVEVNRQKSRGNRRIEAEYDSDLINEKEQSADVDTFPTSADLSSDEEDTVVKKSTQSTPSCLIDTQPEDSGDDDDGEDDKPLKHLLKLRKGISTSRSAAQDYYSSSSSSDEEYEFTGEEAIIEPSQNTRAIESQLQKLDDLDIKTLAEKLLMAPVGENAELKNQIKELTAENVDLQKKEKRLANEKDCIRKQLIVANAQLKGKNALIAQMKKRLDDIQPILDAVQKISQSNDNTASDKSSKRAKSAKSKKSPQAKVKKSFLPPSNNTTTPQFPLPNSHRKKRAMKGIVESNEGNKEVYSTPKQKRDAASKERANVVSISNRKKKKKSNVRGTMTFTNLWKILKTEHGWKYKNAPMPLSGQVYVPPNGDVGMEAKVGIHFFVADDLLWKKAEELGIIDSDMNSQEEFEAVVVQREVLTTKDRRNVVLSKTSSPNKQDKKFEEVISESEEEEPESEEEKELDNGKLLGKLGTLTELSLDRCSSLLSDFLQLGTKGLGHFKRHLFVPIWHCLNDRQGAIDKEISWSYCKSKGQRNLGGNYWFCPPKSKGAKGEFGIDYFTTEEAVVAHVLREVKEYHAFVKSIEDNQEEVVDLEIKLSRAIEQHIPFDGIRNTSASDTNFGARRTNANATLNKTKSPSPKQSKRTHDETRSIVSVSDITIQTRHTRPSKVLKTLRVEGKTAKGVTFSQKTTEGAEILMQINKSDTEYDNLATPSGIKDLLKFRNRSKHKRKAEEKKEDRSPRKREKVLSPAAMCHLTQPDDTESVTFQTPQSRRSKSSDKKQCPLYGLLFFGSGVTNEVKKAVERLGGTYLNDVSGNYLQKELVGKKMFFLSDVKFRRTHKYILASALGVPMLNMHWISALQKLYSEFKDKGGKIPSAFDSRLYSRHR